MKFIVRELGRNCFDHDLEILLNAEYSRLRQEISEHKHNAVKIISVQVINDDHNRWIAIFTCEKGS